MLSKSIQAFGTSLRNKFLIESNQLQSLIDAKRPLKILNATWYMPNDPRNAREEHQNERITESTQFFDIDEIVLPGSNLPHTLPTLEIFAGHMERLRLKPNDHIVCYDSVGIFSAPRAAWMFRYFGATHV
jgi:thiosulfate/3-mercaptopyruvate sulfurtransferase